MKIPGKKIDADPQLTDGQKAWQDDSRRRRDEREAERRELESACQRWIWRAEKPDVVPDDDGGVVDEAIRTVDRILIPIAGGMLRRMNIPRAVAEAQDVVQQWHLQMLNGGFQSYRLTHGGRSFFAYALRSVWTTCVSIRRKMKPPGYIGDEWDERLDPAREAAQQECWNLIESAVVQLPPSQQKVIRLRYHDQMRTKEIAAEIGKSPNTVGSRKLRGLRNLRDHLRGREDDLWPI